MWAPTASLDRHPLSFMFLLQIIYLKEGRIVHQGTLDSIEEADPQLAASWRETMKEISESDAETEDEKMVEERAQLKRSVSQQLEDQKKMYRKQGRYWIGISNVLN